MGLEAPETIEEWETVLRAFKEQDPNGNGKPDEIPYLHSQTDVNRNFLLTGAWGIGTNFYQVDGKVKFGVIQPEYKEYLETMHRWYDEGLIDRDYAATDDKLKDAKVTNNQVGIFIGSTGGGIGKYLTLMKDDPSFQLAALPYPTRVKGERPIVGQKDAVFNGLGAAITVDNKNPEATVKWLDYAYSEEGSYLFNFGIEGESYNWVDGYPKYSDTVMKNPDGLPVNQAMSLYARASYAGPFVQDRRYMEQYAERPEQRESIEIWMKPVNQIHLPLLSLTSEESSKFSSIMTDINTYKDEMLSKFIMGTVSLDTFDNFVSTIKNMGLDEAIAIQQAALDRYHARQ
ncbi:extracellular solute-binding protein [Paenibacillus sp. GCM10027626]|uniref:extracellular solute-binding protein n=1 Tax=Paenibacillus sp. GCM10027626 TaxID=3273411 RepID=UPI003635D91E